MTSEYMVPIMHSLAPIRTGILFWRSFSSQGTTTAPQSFISGSSVRGSSARGFTSSRGVSHDRIGAGHSKFEGELPVCEAFQTETHQLEYTPAFHTLASMQRPVPDMNF